jgi:hypothetical protein
MREVRAVQGLHIETKGLSVPFRSLAGLDQVEESEGSGSEAGGGRGLEKINDPKRRAAPSRLGCLLIVGSGGGTVLAISALCEQRTTR